MIRFGPAGNSEIFYQQGHKHTYEAFAWIAQMGLDAYEYSFGRGIRILKPTAEQIGREAERYGVALSVHAPYYINLATQDPDNVKANLRYLKESATAAQWMGARRVVFHPGSLGGADRADAFSQVKKALVDVVGYLKEAGLADIALCPETMGRVKQIGDLDEVIALCRLDERLIPTIDFGHLHARDKGAIRSESDYASILDTLENALGSERAKRFHAHFSRIEFTAAGEKRHRTFADREFGPDFGPLARQIIRRGLEPVMICESKGTMAQDAAEMKRIYLEELDKR